MEKNYKNLLLVIIALVTSGLSYAQTFATFTSANSGVLGTVPFTISMDAVHSPEIATTNLQGDSYSSYEGSWGQPVIKIKPGADFECTITFNEAIPNLKFYIADWLFATFEFNENFTILSNYDLTATDSKTLTVGVADGIIQFDNPVTTLTFKRTSGSSSRSHYFTFAGGSTLGINDVYAENVSLKLFPNPSSDFIQISGLKATEKYEIFNVLGSVVKSGVISDNQKIRISNLMKGIYILKLEKGNTIKFVKK
ncbi:T9SS type A sorting domain-containing protein [Formosa sediminum]|uniref:T9SS type A sorting domain-containing protein n=1 Tax=Formosa sediminum TaxID=2594004 RepID=A0A516GVM6_9FLAO|nr:T9SS type A sorting domain-containing protein [Formosa sediminum]QDO95525.1 T9SS type A sorting domain-containing protein [Formosa sediminum]